MTKSSRTLICTLPIAALAAALHAHAQPAQQPDESCGDIARNYDAIKADATSVQTSLALFAAARRGCEALARSLLDGGASLLARDRRGAMPLAHAAREGQVRLVELFLEKGAPVDARNVDGSTALFSAAEAEKHATVALLLAKGADPKSSRSQGRDAADCCGLQGQ